MPDAGYFVRVRGRISGPFDIETLRRMARTGALSRIHEISPDRTSWARASHYEDLFPMAGSTRAGYDPIEEPILTPIEMLDVAPPATAPLPPRPPQLPMAARGPFPGNPAEPARHSKTIYVVLLIVGLLFILCIGAAVAILLASWLGTPAPSNAPGG